MCDLYSSWHLSSFFLFSIKSSHSSVVCFFFLLSCYFCKVVRWYQAGVLGTYVFQTSQTKCGTDWEANVYSR